MNNSNQVTILLTAVLTVVLVFFLLNNGVHTGFHVGHIHDDSENMGMMDEQDDEDGHHEEHGVDSFEIYPSKLVEKINNNEDIILLDVRTLEEHEEIHLKNSLLLPVGEISANTLAGIGLGEGMKDKEIILYCRSGGRSKQAYDIMNSLGYTNIKSVSGGMVHWEEDNYPFAEVGEYQRSTTYSVEASDSGAQISFDRTTHNFGDVPQSQGILETTFEVKNEGESVLEIGELSTSCGCTKAEISSNSIKPNSKATLTVYFDPDFHKEPADELTRTVFIPTNDPSNPEAEVKITVDILEGE
jgi:rhodanese-related sulfurtransferase